MQFLGWRYWPVPVLKTMWPFYIAGAVTFWGVTKIQAIGIQSPEYAHDPRNPYIAKNAASAQH